VGIGRKRTSGTLKAEQLLQRWPWYWLTIEVSRASRRGIRAPLQRLLREGAGGVSIARRLEAGSLSRWSGLVRVGEDYAEWIGRLSRRGVGVEARRFGQRFWNGQWGAFRVSDLVAGFGADFVIGALWQLGEDVLTHSELLQQPDFLARRAVAAGLSNATVGFFATLTVGGVASIAAMFGASVASPVIVVGGVAVAVAIDIWQGERIQDWWTEKMKAQAVWE
jgi:hypothetical protein